LFVPGARLLTPITGASLALGVILPRMLFPLCRGWAAVREKFPHWHGVDSASVVPAVKPPSCLRVIVGIAVVGPEPAGKGWPRPPYWWRRWYAVRPARRTARFSSLRSP